MTNSTPSTLFGLYGAGGFAREVMPFAQLCVNGSETCFIETEPSAASINGIKVASEKEFFAASGDKKYFNIAIADSKARSAIADRCIAHGCTPITLRAGQATVYEPASIGEGAIICAYTIIMPNTTIGRFFHANIYSYVAHDCVVGDFVTFAPAVKCNGNVHIGNHAYIGTGAILRNGQAGKPLVIGEGAVIGMGAVVTKDVAPYTTVVGNPARPLTK